MDSQSKIRYLKIGIGVFEKEIEFARRKTKVFKEIYLTADKKFKQYLKRLSLDPSASPGQDTGECSDDFTPQNHFLLAEMKKLLAKRIHLLAEVANLVAEGEKETINYLQINIKFLQMLIECEKYKTAEFKKRYIGMAEECKEVLYKLNDHLDEFTVEIVFKFDPQLAQKETLLTRREKQPSPVKDCEKWKSDPTESQKAIDQLQSKLAMLEIILEYEKRDTEKYKQLFLKVVEKYEEMLNRIKQRPSSCTCDPNIRPVQHRHECNIAFTRDDEELLTDMEVFRIEMRTCVVLIEEGAGHEVAAITEKSPCRSRSEECRHCPLHVYSGWSSKGKLRDWKEPPQSEVGLLQQKSAKAVEGCEKTNVIGVCERELQQLKEDGLLEVTNNMHLFCVHLLGLVT